MASTLAKLILFLVIALILIVFFGKVALFGRECSDLWACRLSVLASSKISKEVVEIKCPMKEVEITKADEDVIKKELAGEMAHCWYKMGEGKVSPFERDWFHRKRICVLHSEIEFDKKVQEKIPTINNFLTYLADNEVDAKCVKRNITYFTYFTGAEIENKEELRRQIIDSIDTKEKYNIFYIIDKDRKLGVDIGVAAGAVVGTVLLFVPIPGARIIGIGKLIATAGIVTKTALTAGAIYKGYQFGKEHEKDYITIALIPQDIQLGEGGMECDELRQ